MNPVRYRLVRLNREYSYDNMGNVSTRKTLNGTGATFDITKALSRGRCVRRKGMLLMAGECNHEFRVRFGGWSFIKVKCIHCGTHFSITRKYRCLCYGLGLIGWVPSLIFDYSGMTAWLKILLSVIIYVAFNLLIWWLFYLFIRNLPADKLMTYIESDDDEFHE